MAGAATALRAEIARGLRTRRREIEASTVTRLNTITEPQSVSNPEYREGLRAALTVALEYAISAIETGDERSLPIPPPLISQARLAACNGVSLDTVLRRYFAGFTLFSDFVLQEAEALVQRREISVRRLFQAQTRHFDQLITTICGEYTREREKWLRSSDRREAERVERLLHGELVDPASIPVDFESWHVAVVAKGHRMTDVLSAVAASLDLRVLVVRPHGGVVWGWLGAQRPFSLIELQEELKRRVPEDGAIAIGEAGEGLAGWRASHQQALACLPVATRGAERVVRYADVGLMAALLNDWLLISTLNDRYLRPLSEGREAGDVLRETLRAYLRAERNVSSTAAALGLSRSTVNNRLRAIERRLGRSLGSCSLELEIALRLDALPE